MVEIIQNTSYKYFIFLIIFNQILLIFMLLMLIDLSSVESTKSLYYSLLIALLFVNILMYYLFWDKVIKKIIINKPYITIFTMRRISNIRMDEIIEINRKSRPLQFLMKNNIKIKFTSLSREDSEILMNKIDCCLNTK